MNPASQIFPETQEDEPHQVHNLTPLEALAAMPYIRRQPVAAAALSRLAHAIADPRSLPTAYETLANFGELQRTANGYRATDPRTLLDRCRRLHSAILPFA